MDCTCCNPCGSFGFAQDFACGLPLRSRPQSGSSSNPSISAIKYFLICNLDREFEISVPSRQTRRSSGLKGTGEHSPPESTAWKFDGFTIRVFRSPFSNCSKTEPGRLGSGLDHPTKHPWENRHCGVIRLPNTRALIGTDSRNSAPLLRLLVGQFMVRGFINI